MTKADIIVEGVDIAVTVATVPANIGGGSNGGRCKAADHVECKM